LPEAISSHLTELTKEMLDPLTVTQLKKVRALIDEAMVKNNEDLTSHEAIRDGLLRELGNWLHPSVPVSNNEV
jgi:seryl-tRNA synthetase